MRRHKSQTDIDLQKKRERTDYFKAVYRGQRLREIITSRGWQEFVVPYIKSEEERLILESRFNPAKDYASVEKLAFLNSFNSGSISMLNSLQEEIARWINEGEEAAKKLKEFQKPEAHENKMV